MKKATEKEEKDKRKREKREKKDVKKRDRGSMSAEELLRLDEVRPSPSLSVFYLHFIKLAFRALDWIGISRRCCH
jgi:hypothetical protein